MAHNRSYKPEDIRFPDQVITESNLVDEMEKSYIEYAMSVIVKTVPIVVSHPCTHLLLRKVRRRKDIAETVTLLRLALLTLLSLLCATRHEEQNDKYCEYFSHTYTKKGDQKVVTPIVVILNRQVCITRGISRLAQREKAEFTDA